MPLVGVVHDPLARRLNEGNSGNAGVFSNAEDLAVICAAIIILTNRVHPYDKGSVSRLRATIANVVMSSIDTYQEEY